MHRIAIGGTGWFSQQQLTHCFTCSPQTGKRWAERVVWTRDETVLPHDRVRTGGSSGLGCCLALLCRCRRLCSPALAVGAMHAPVRVAAVDAAVAHTPAAAAAAQLGGVGAAFGSARTRGWGSGRRCGLASQRGGGSLSHTGQQGPDARYFQDAAAKQAAANVLPNRLESLADQEEAQTLDLSLITAQPAERHGCRRNYFPAAGGVQQPDKGRHGG